MFKMKKSSDITGNDQKLTIEGVAESTQLSINSLIDHQKKLEKRCEALEKCMNESSPEYMLFEKEKQLREESSKLREIWKKSGTDAEYDAWDKKDDDWRHLRKKRSLYKLRNFITFNTADPTVTFFWLILGVVLSTIIFIVYFRIIQNVIWVMMCCLMVVTGTKHFTL